MVTTSRSYNNSQHTFTKQQITPQKKIYEPLTKFK